MSRGIPKVRRWKVKAYDEKGRLVGTTYVDTINRSFARWLARDKFLAILGANAWVHQVVRLTASVAQ